VEETLAGDPVPKALDLTSWDAAKTSRAPQCRRNGVCHPAAKTTSSVLPAASHGGMNVLWFLDYPRHLYANRFERA
jgi:hypothetical protein